MLFTDLETERLLLRGIMKQDAGFILKHFSSDFVSMYLYDAEPISTIDAATEIIAFYLQAEPRAQQRWIIIHKASGEKIGTIGYHCWDSQEHKAEIGYDLAEEYTGAGYMSEALNAVLDFGRKHMKLLTIEAHIYIDNAKSIRLAIKHGFGHEGEMSECFRGKKYLHYVYRLSFKQCNQTWCGQL